MTSDDLTFEEIGEERHDVLCEEDVDSGDSGSFTYTYGFPISTSSGVVVPTVSTGSTTTVASSGGYKITSAPTPSVPSMIFDLCELGISQVGSFSMNGLMVGWITSTASLSVDYPAWMNGQAVVTLLPSPGYEVLIRGIYSKYFTNERRVSMGLVPVP